MIIDRAIVATDNNDLYYEFWPLVAKAWRNIGIEPTAAAIGGVNLNYSFGTVIKMPLIEGIPSSFIAQVIRFIIPCFFSEEVSVTGDMDMIPLKKDYFQKNIAGYSNDAIIIFSSDAYRHELRYPMCYIAAKGKYFQEIIGLENLRLETITNFIRDLFALNKNWDTDELFFAEQLSNSVLLKRTIFLTRGGWKPFAKNRIDRVRWQYTFMGLTTNSYIDAHCLRPLHDNLNNLRGIINYVDQGSDGRKYFKNSLKKHINWAYNVLKMFRQNHFPRDLYDVAEEKLSEKRTKKVISFSLYGNSPRYFANLNDVIHSYKNFFPGWELRLYIAKDIAPSIIQNLLELGCGLIIMNSSGIHSAYTTWRFLAMEDKNAEAVIMRDLDSIATLREKTMIDQWLSSQKKVHIIRDHVNHNARIMAGMWGLKPKLLNINLKKAAGSILMTNNYGIDQVFLENIIYPLIKNSVFIHDSFPRFPEEEVVVIPLPPGESFIGEIYDPKAGRQKDNEYITTYHKRCFIIN